MCSYFGTVAEQEVEKTALLLLQFQRTGEPWMSETTGSMPWPKLEYKPRKIADGLRYNKIAP